MSGAGKAQYLVVVVLPCRASSHVTDSGAAGIASTSSAVHFWYRSGSRATGQGRGGEMAGRAKSCCCCCCCSVQSCWLLQPPLLRTGQYCCHYCCLGSPGPGLLQSRRPFLWGKTKLGERCRGSRRGRRNWMDCMVWLWWAKFGSACQKSASTKPPMSSPPQKHPPARASARPLRGAKKKIMT